MVKNKVTHGELFAGIGGFGLAADRAGMQTIWHVEIDKHAQKVLKRHWPDTQLEADVTQVGAHNLPPVDVLTFGSPCQDLSIAGKREGMKDGTRSNLFFEAARIIRELNPSIALWENVPGALSSNRGEDFRAVLREMLRADVPMPRSGRWAAAGMARSGSVDLAWRILDAQYFGVAQRRRRIILVADFRGQRAGEVLFEQHSGTGNTPPSREEGKADPGTFVMAHGQANAEIVRDGSPSLTLNHEAPIVFDNSESAIDIRRLTPTECERLQGFPDGWTDGQADTQRYKQLGNAVAVPVAQWVLSRIEQHMEQK